LASSSGLRLELLRLVRSVWPGLGRPSFVTPAGSSNNFVGLRQRLSIGFVFWLRPSTLTGLRVHTGLFVHCLSAQYWSLPGLAFFVWAGFSSVRQLSSTSVCLGHCHHWVAFVTGSGSLGPFRPSTTGLGQSGLSVCLVIGHWVNRLQSLAGFVIVWLRLTGLGHSGLRHWAGSLLSAGCLSTLPINSLSFVLSATSLAGWVSRAVWVWVRHWVWSGLGLGWVIRPLSTTGLNWPSTGLSSAWLGPSVCLARLANWAFNTVRASSTVQCHWSGLGHCHH